MAFHPFRTFQRNQKGCLAGATLLAMISFLFLGVIIQLLSGRGGPGSQIETFAECRHFGPITSIELSRLNEEQDTLQRFLIVLLRSLADPADEAKMQALYPLEMFINQVAQGKIPERLIDNWLITQYAQEIGIAPDWSDIQNFLKELTGNYLSDAVYEDTLNSVGISQPTIEYLLSRHIAQQQISEQVNLSVSAVSPATRWDWYQRLHRQVTVEAVSVPIDSFIDQVGEPSDSQLNAFFEENKEKRYSPISAETGFIMPTEVAFQYVVAEPNQQILDSITDEEMLAYYEANKETLFRKQTRPLTDYPQLPGMMPGLGMPAGSMPFPTPDRPVVPVPTTPAPTETVPPTNETAPVTEESKPTEPATEEKPAESSAVPRVTLKYVSYQNEEGEETADGGQQTAAEEEPKAEEPVKEEPKTEEPKVEEPAKEEPKTEEPKVEESAKEEPKTEEPKTEEPETVDLSILYQPFDEVKDQIRDTLAREKAAAKLPLIQAKMQEYAAAYNAQFEQGKPTPPMPDLTGFVAEQGFELKTVPMGDVYAAMRTELARGTQERSLIAQLYLSTPLLFESATYLGSNGQLLYWVTEQKPELRPESMDEVKDVVLKRWKEVEARTLAQKKAEELENEAKTAKKPLAEVFSGRSDVTVVETEAFTWKTYGGLNPMAAVIQRQPPMLSEVREKGIAVGSAEIDNKVIAAPGTDFMKTVFSLEIGETGVVFNQPQTAVYVVRVTSSSPSTEVLWEQFQTAFYMEYYFAGQPEMIAEAYDAWIADIQKKTGFRWINKPETPEY